MINGTIGLTVLAVLMTTFIVMVTVEMIKEKIEREREHELN